MATASLVQSIRFPFIPPPPLSSSSSSSSFVTFSRRRRTTSSINSSKNKQQGLRRNIDGKLEDIDDRNDLLTVFGYDESEAINEDDFYTEEELKKMGREIEEALADIDLLAVFDDDTHEAIKVVNKKVTTVNHVIQKEIPVINRDEEEVEEDESEYEDEEGPLELKRWQLIRRLADALKDGRLKTSNAMISNIVHVTKIPRKKVLKVLKWFQDKRGEDGVPDQRQPYQRFEEEE